MSWQQHSKIYLDTAESMEVLVTWVSACVGGAAHPSGAEGNVLDVYIDENDERDQAQVDDPDQGFLFYPYLVDVDARPGVAIDTYREALDGLLRSLARPGVRFVTAAEDEPSLWSGGRWDGGAPVAR